MNEWMNEWLDEWLDEYMNKCMNERTNEWMNSLWKYMKMGVEGMNWRNEEMNEWMNEKMEIGKYEKLKIYDFFIIHRETNEGMYE